MNNSINLQQSLSVLNNNVSYEAARTALTQNGYRTVVYRESPSQNIISIEVEATLNSHNREVLNDVFGYKFNIREDARSNVFVMTLKK